MNSHAGSCLCGRVKFKVQGKFESFFLCHCQFCRKDSGSAHGANLFSSSAALKWIQGKESVKYFHLPQTQHARSFCGECGSALPDFQMGGKLLVVPAGSLDGDPGIRPSARIYCANRAAWDQDLAHLQELPGPP